MAQNQRQRPGDVMSQSYGEGYAMMCDDEGFGGTYSGNQMFSSNLQKDQPPHDNHPAYDKTQGSEVKEKENSRNQTDTYTST